MAEVTGYTIQYSFETNIMKILSHHTNIAVVLACVRCFINYDHLMTAPDTDH